MVNNSTSIASNNMGYWFGKKHLMLLSTSYIGVSDRTPYSALLQDGGNDSRQSSSGFCWSMLAGSGLCTLPMCMFRPRLESDEKSHWSHLKGLLISVLWEVGSFAGGWTAAACWSMSLLGGNPFSLTRRSWYDRSDSSFFCPPLLLFFLFLFI